MAWEQVAAAQVSSQGVQGDAWRSVEELPVGTDGYLSFQAPGIGPIMDTGGVEAIARGVFWAKGVDIKVLDCYGEGDNGYIRFTGSPAGVVAILIAVAAVLEILLYLGIVVVVGLFIWKAVSVIQKLVEHPEAILLIGGFVLGGLYLAGRRK
jgi:hypothetical protein